MKMQKKREEKLKRTWRGNMDMQKCREQGQKKDGKRKERTRKGNEENRPSKEKEEQLDPRCAKSVCV